jgi:hypothetical protein
MTPDRWFDLGLNLFSEVLGIFVTVFFVDRILKSREERRWKASKIFVYSKLLHITTGILENFIPASKSKMPERVVYLYGKLRTGPVLDITYENVWEQKTEAAIAEHMQKRDNEGLSSIIEHLLNAQKQLSEVVNDYGFFLDPELLSFVLTIENSINPVAERLRWQAEWDARRPPREGVKIKRPRLPDQRTPEMDDIRVLVFSIRDLQKMLRKHSTATEEVKKHRRIVFT